jgi:dolichyl-phosphate beta-glucosyltransferase
MVHLSIIIPAYNEADRIGQTLESTFAYLAEQPYSSEVLVVNDGSQDATREVVAHYQERFGPRLRLLDNPGNRGKGYAVRNGMLAAEGEILLFYDADLATPLSELPLLLGPIEEGRYDVVFGSRALDRSLIGRRQSRVREMIGRIGNLVQYLFTGLPYHDTQCGCKAFRREVATRVFPLQRIDGFGFDPEILFLARTQGWRLLETPVRWNHIPGSKVHLLATPLKALLEVMRIWWNRKTGKYREHIS